MTAQRSALSANTAATLASARQLLGVRRALYDQKEAYSRIEHDIAAYFANSVREAYATQAVVDRLHDSIASSLEAPAGVCAQAQLHFALLPCIPSLS